MESSHGRFRRRVLTSLLAISAAAALAPASASAAFHLTKISEVFPGTVACPDCAFVELQSFEAGQNSLNGHTVRSYSSSGALLNTFVIPGNAPNPQSQRTVLIGDGSVSGRDFTANFGTLIVASGGAVCFDAIPVDCVAWGNITPAGVAALPGAVGAPVSPALGIPDGSSISRSITPGCATLLEATDDTDNSSLDFAVTAPNPRPNTIAPTEVACGGAGGGGQGGGGATSPETTIDKGPKKVTTKRAARFRFSSTSAGAGFECALDKKPFKPCSSPLKIRRVKLGKHVFRVRAVLAGARDATPATYKWKRRRR
ncbi:MAG: hypothetical protein ABIZ50_00385 [Solirubrobacterales bacterium]